MSFETHQKRVKTVGELKKCLEKLPDGAEIAVFDNENETWEDLYVSFNASYFDAWNDGDEVRAKWQEHDVWISSVDFTCRPEDDYDPELDWTDKVEPS